MPTQAEEAVEEGKTTVLEADPKWKGMYKYGAISAFIVFAGYLAIIALYIPVVPVPESGKAMLEYLNGKTTIWWAIVGVSVITEIPYAIVAFALYQSLKRIDRNTMALAVGFKWLFVILELAITWIYYIGLFSLSNSYASATTDAERAAYIAAADFATGIIYSNLLPVYTILLPALGSLLIGLVMRKGIFGKATAYLGVAAGALGIVHVIASFFTSALGQLIIFVSLLTMIWFLLVGARLLKLSRAQTGDNVLAGPS